MPASRSAPTLPSNTKLVLDLLVQADDFLATAAIAAAVHIPTHSAMTALCWLRTAKAVDSVPSAGELHWFATPETDQRSKVCDEHKKEDEPRKPKRQRGVVLPRRD